MRNIIILSVLQYLSSVLLSGFYYLQPVSANNDRDCPCQKLRPKDIIYSITDHVTAGEERQIQCCFSRLDGFEDPNAVIRWTFEGKPAYHLTQVCKGETLYIKKVDDSDSGRYTCTITTSNGTTASITTHLIVHPTEELREKAKGISVSEKEVYAKEGDSASFTCQAYVGKPTANFFTPSLIWWYSLSPDKHVNLPKGVTFNSSNDDKNYIMRGQLTIKSVTKEHFGKYVCIVANTRGSIMDYVQLIEGDPPMNIAMTNSKLVLLSAISAIGMVLWLLYLWWRCRRSFKVYYMEKSSMTSHTDGYLYDIFIVHGELASGWVRELLLPTLEKTYHYRCFVPDRDMLGGEQLADSICKAMLKCRRVLVVISPCLLRSQWATWGVQQGIHTCLTSQSRILAVVLQELEMDSVSLDTTEFLSTLQMIKQIKVPKACGLYDLDEELRTSICPGKSIREKGERGQPIVPKLNIPEYLIKDSGSKSPTNKRLSNMITGSNNASREDLDDVKDPQVKGQKNSGVPVVYIEDADGLEDPGTPCSITPFILPSCKKDRQVHGSIFNCLRAAFFGDPEIIFWQTVRLRLDPPAIKPKYINDESKA